MFSKSRCTCPATLSTENRKLFSRLTQLVSPPLLAHRPTKARTEAGQNVGGFFVDLRKGRQTAHQAPEEPAVQSVGHGRPGPGHARDPESLGRTQRHRALRMPDRGAEPPRGSGAGAGPVAAMVLSTATEFGLSATRIQQAWAESSALKSTLMCPISSFPLGQAALPGRRDEPQKKPTVFPQWVPCFILNWLGQCEI